MPGRPTISKPGRGAFHLLHAGLIFLGCSAPDGSGLFQPLPTGGAAGSSSGAAGRGGGASTGGSGVLSGGTGGRASEGQGGSLALAGAGGSAGVPGSDEMFEADPASPDAGALDAGVVRDAGPPPITCEGGGPEICDGRDNDCDGQVDPGQTCPDACSGFALADHGYMVCSASVDRAAALARCAAQGMKLAWLETSAENAAVVSRIAALDLLDGAELLVQIGSTDALDEDEWFWVGVGAARNGFQFWQGNTATDDAADVVDGAYANWAPTEPNDTDGDEDCGVLSVTGSDFRTPGEWDDRACSVPSPFLCEVP